MIRYRKPGRDDAAILQLIESQLVPLSHLSHNQLDAIRKDIPARLSRGITLVASPNRKRSVIAFIHFMPHNDWLYIDMLAVAPAIQRKHLGTSLMKHAEKIALSRGCKRAKVMVDIGNQKGLSFYQKLGYRIVRIVTPNQCYEMEKTL